LEFEYQAFISYSHAADGRLAPALQRGLQRIGKRWYQRARFKAFRDATSLSANAALWPDLERQLARCAWFVLMASPAAAASPWVGREVAWWLRHRSIDRLLIVISDGELAWDERSGDFDADRSTCLPAQLRGSFAAEPLYVDLRWAQSAEQMSLRHARFRDAVLTLAAPLHGRAKDELDSEEIRQHQRFVLAASTVGAGALALALLAAFALWNAHQEAARAEASWREAESRRLATQAVDKLVRDQAVEDAIKVALMAWMLARTDEAAAALEKLATATTAMAGILGQHTGGLAAVAFSDDSAQLATLGRDGSLQLWRTGSWQRAAATLQGKLSNARGLRFNATGTHLVAWNEAGTMDVWDLAAQQSAQVAAGTVGDSHWRSAAISNDGMSLAISSNRGDLRLWDRRASVWRRAPADLGNQHVVGMQFDTDTRLRLALIDRQLRIAVWDVATGTWTQGPPDPVATHQLAYTDQAAFAASGQRLATSGDGAGAVFEIDAALKTRRLAALDDLATNGCQQAQPDTAGRQLMVRHDKRWELIDVARPDPPLAQGSAPPFTCSNWSPDLRWRADRPARTWSADEARWERLWLWDQRAPDSATAAKTLNTACGFRDDPSGCAKRLCDSLRPTLDEAQLRKLFGIENYVVRYERYRAVLGGPLCSATGSGPPGPPASK